MQLYIDLIKEYFKSSLPRFELLSEVSHGANWAVRFSNGDVEINISGDVGFEIQILIGSSKYELWQYDRSVNKLMKTSDENIKRQLNVLKRFLKEVSAG